MLGTYYVLTGSFSVTVLSVSSVVGALIGGVLIVNEFKDAATDRIAGKRNLAVRVIDLYARLSAAKQCYEEYRHVLFLLCRGSVKRMPPAILSMAKVNALPPNRGRDEITSGLPPIFAPMIRSKRATDTKTTAGICLIRLLPFSSLPHNRPIKRARMSGCTGWPPRSFRSGEIGMWRMWVLRLWPAYDDRG